MRTEGKPRRKVLAASTLSRHARQRIRDRSIPQFIIDALIDFGERKHAGDGTESCFFTKQTWKTYAAYLGKEARQFERFRSAYVILGSDGMVVTACWRH